MAVKVTTDEVRRTVRTAIAVIVALAALVPVLVDAGVIDAGRWPWVGTIVVAAAAITRAMQSPVVDKVLRDLGVGRDPKVIPGDVVDEPAPAIDEPLPSSGAQPDA